MWHCEMGASSLAGSPIYPRNSFKKCKESVLEGASGDQTLYMTASMQTIEKTLQPHGGAPSGRG